MSIEKGDSREPLGEALAQLTGAVEEWGRNVTARVQELTFKGTDGKAIAIAPSNVPTATEGVLRRKVLQHLEDGPQHPLHVMEQTYPIGTDEHHASDPTSQQGIFTTVVTKMMTDKLVSWTEDMEGIELRRKTEKP